MSTLHKFKAYFGMVPLEDYEDDYVEPARAPRRDGRLESRPAPRDRYRTLDDEYRPRQAFEGEEYDYRADDYREGDFRERRDFDSREFGRGGYDDHDSRAAYAYDGSARRRDDYDDIDHLPAARSPRLTPAAPRGGASRPAPVTHGALAIDSHFDESSALARITALRPSSYSEARTIGERFRDGSPVIMNLSDMDNADAKRLVDFAAGLAFALRGSFDKVATKVFLLAPIDVEVTPEDRKKIAETGFYNQD